MAPLTLQKPLEVLLINDTIIGVQNLDYYSPLLATYTTGPNIGNWESFDLEHNCESGTITYQSIGNINNDSNPPLLFISPVSIFDQDPTLTLETFFARPKSIIDIKNLRRNGAVIPSVNYSGALFSSFPSASVLQVQGSNNPLQKFPTSGKIIINKEVISYTGKTTNTLTGVSRAQDGSVLGTHNSGNYLRTISI
jgi:hypothetical protein